MRTHPTPRPRRLLAAVLLAAAALWAPAPAWAHAQLAGSTPALGQVLDEPPAEVSLQFTDRVAAPAYVVVTAPDGSAATVGSPQVAGDTVTQALTSTDLEGTYAMAYRAVSEDGHPVTGEITFSVGRALRAATPPRGPATAPSPTAGAGDPAATEPASGWSDLRLEIGVAASLLLGAAALVVASRRVDD